MPERAAKPREEGEGWEAWLDEEGFLWTKDSLAQHGISAAARVEAIERLLQAHPRVLGIIVDDRRFGGTDTPAAKEAYAGFVRRHPRMPIAMVTTHAESARTAFEVRAAGQGLLKVFATVQAAKVWIRRERQAP